MFEYFTFSAHARMNESSHGGGVSPTNTHHIETANHESNGLQATPPAINELVVKLSSQTLNSSHLPSNGLPTHSPTRTADLLSPVENIDTQLFPLPTNDRDINPCWKYHTYPPPPHRDQEMAHPNLFSSFLPQSAGHCSRRTQRQILQEQQCRPTFTRDLQQLLEEMIEKGDQCSLATNIVSSPPPSRGRDRGFSASSIGMSPTHKSHREATHEDEGFCETEETFVPYISTFNLPSTSSSTPTLRSAATSVHSRCSASDSRRSSRHRRVASEGNIDIDFDIHDGVAYRETSLRRAGLPIGISKLGRPRGRGSTNTNTVVDWRKNVPRLRKSQQQMFKRKGT